MPSTWVEVVETEKKNYTVLSLKETGKQLPFGQRK